MEKKSFLLTELFCFFFGWLGVHRFYTGYIGLGILQLVTLGGCGIWSIIDLIMISLGKYKTANGSELEEYNPTIGYAAIIIWVVIFSLCFLSNAIR